ncbi:unnamed protein product [Euphydryas editha]|uniref:Uncharacterized protein n=1 Tax=Euphydryas editha TaxID=104508 RepID=A0AAU9U2B7_EUPED|nr:unnamed protein product [Euphydryas editha]
MQIADNSILEQNDIASETSLKHYVTLNDNKAILRGSFNQGDLRFHLSRGKQCTGLAAVACAAFTVLDPNKWAKSDIDYIVIIDDKYYNDCITARDNPALGEVNLEYLAVTDLSARLIYNRQHLVITVLEEINYNTSDGFPNLKNALLSFFREHSQGILTANATSVAIHCRTLGDNKTYYLLNFHARGSKGASTPINGSACCMRFSDLDDLHAVLRRNLFVSPNKVPEGNFRDNLNVFSLTSLVIAQDTQTQPLKPILDQATIVRMESQTYIKRFLPTYNT